MGCFFRGLKVKDLFVFTLAFLGLMSGARAAEPVLHQTIRKLPDAATSVAFSPNSELVAVGSYETVEIWKIADKSKVGSLPVKSGFARSLAFSPDGTQLAIGGYQKIHLHAVDSRQLIRNLEGHRGYVTAVLWNRAGDQIYSASEDKTIRCWSLPLGTESRQWREFPAAIMGLSLSRDEQLLAMAGGDETQLTKPGFAQIRKITGELVHELPAPKMAATDILFTPDQKQVILTGYNERGQVFSTESGALIADYPGHARPTNSVSLAGDGALAVTASGGRFQGKHELHIWSLADLQTVAVLEPAKGKLNRATVSSNGKWMAVASADKTATVWNIEGLTPPAPATSKTQPMTTLTTGPTFQFVDTESPMKRIGIIGLDTSHSLAFAKTFNANPVVPALAGMRVTVAYPHGSKDIEGSVSRIPGYTEEIKKLGVTVVESLPALLEQVDYVLLETNDGRPHLEQALAVFQAGKPVFIDKPVAGSLEDAVAIYEAARHYKVPVFSSSSLRFMEDAQAARQGSCGQILGCDTFSPCSLEKTHPDLFWYGIHGVEILYTVMGPGCQSVTRSSTPQADVVMGTWSGGRIGTFRGMRSGKSGYGGNVFGTDKFMPLGNFKGYDPLVMAIGEFFKTGQLPVTEEETLELYAFMEAADESKRQGGNPVSVPATLEKARSAARGRLRMLLNQE